jgi:hypothetical protein
MNPPAEGNCVRPRISEGLRGRRSRDYILPTGEETDVEPSPLSSTGICSAPILDHCTSSGFCTAHGRVTCHRKMARKRMRSSRFKDGSVLKEIRRRKRTFTLKNRGSAVSGVELGVKVRER